MIHRKLKGPKMQWQKDHNKNSFNKQNKNFTRASHSFVHFFAILFLFYFAFYYEHKQAMMKFYSLNLNLDMVHTNSNPVGFANI